MAKGERVDKLVREQGRPGEPGDDRGPAEVEQRPRRDMLGDAGGGAVGRRGLERGDLHEVEVIEEPDPHDAGHEMEPPCHCGNVVHAIASVSG